MAERMLYRIVVYTLAAAAVGCFLVAIPNRAEWWLRIVTAGMGVFYAYLALSIQRPR